MKHNQDRETYHELAVEFLKDLIAIPTVNPPGNEKQAALYVLRRMKEFGIEGELQEVAEGRANVMFCLGGGPDTVILTGHLDVVPAGGGWTGNPFQAREQDGRIYGRGSCDMKAGIAAMMVTVIMMRDRLDPGMRLVLLFTADEEIDGTGTCLFLEQCKPWGRNAVIIGEPTENEINIAHRGVIRLRVLAHGLSCHSGQPEDGVNAVQELCKVVAELGKVHGQMQKIHHPFLPSPTLSVTRISGGTKDNVIPGECECVLDCRTIPGDSQGDLIRLVNDCITHTPGLNPGISFEIIPFIEVMPGMAEPDGEEIVLAQRAYEAVMGVPAVLKDFPACCDMSRFLADGYRAFLCGPGSIDQAHTANEYVEVDQIWQSVMIYNNFISIFPKK